MSDALHAALSSLQQRAAWEDVAARSGGPLGAAAARAARLRKCAQELAACTDHARAREVLCRHAALARDHTGRFLNTLAAELRPLARALDEAAGDAVAGAV